MLRRRRVASPQAHDWSNYAAQSGLGGSPAQAALAGPALAAPSTGTGAIHGRIVDSVTGTAFPMGSGRLLLVDAFALDTMARRVVVVSDADGNYLIDGLAPGDYKVRFRYWNAAGDLTRYRWNSGKANFETADAVTVLADASRELDAILKPMRGARVSGSLTERDTGTALTSACYTIHLYEASGISLGWFTGPDPGGSWEIPKVPAGQWKALASYSVGTLGDPPIDCGTGPAHLDTWYRGPSGWPLFKNSLVAHWATHSSAATFGVTVGVPVENVDIEMLRAPTCRGKVPTIFGTTLADEIVGTAGRDIIAGLAGNDWIAGKAGNDLICGGPGSDTIDAGAGLRDIIDGGTGKDTCKNGEQLFNCNP